MLVAHNAQFDYGFLAAEFSRAGVELPVSRRLCTLALNRRIGPPTADLRLATLAAHYGVRQQQAHDALDDTRVLGGILRGSLAAAARLELRLPLIACPPQQRGSGASSPRSAAPARRIPCPYRNPGRWEPGGQLVQGMKVAITGATRTPRTALGERATAAGLNVVTSVSRHTGLLVANDAASDSAKARRTAEAGVPVVDEVAFLRLLTAGVGPGVRHDTTGPGPSEVPTQVPRAEEPVVPARPLRGHRVLVLGGHHSEARAARELIVRHGGAAAVNLSAGVTDIVALPGAERDRRMSRITALRVPVHESAWLTEPAPGGSTAPEPANPAAPRAWCGERCCGGGQAEAASAPSSTQVHDRLMPYEDRSRSTPRRPAPGDEPPNEATTETTRS